MLIPGNRFMVIQFRQKIEIGFGRLAHLIYRNHWKVLFLILMLVAALASQLPKLTMDTSTEGFLHADDPALISYDHFRDQFGRDEVLAVAITAPDIFDLQFLTKLKQLHEELRDNVPYLDDITSLINARNTRGEASTLIVEDLLEQWPESADALAEIKQRALNNPLYRNLLLSEDSTTTVIVIKTDAYSSLGMEAESSDDFGDAAFEDDMEAAKVERKFFTDEENNELVIAVHQIAERYNGSNFQVRIGGGPEVMFKLKQTMQTNMERFVRLAFAVIAIALFIMFRRISGVILPLLVVLLSLLSTLSVMAMAGIAFKLPTQILPSFLMAVGVGASVHVLAIFFSHLQQNHTKEESIAYAMGHSGLAIVMTSLTTAAGLASFAGAEVAPIADLGLLASSGVLLSLFFTILLLPALLSIIPLKAKISSSSEKRHARMDKVVIGIADFATHRYKLILVVSGIVLVLGVMGAAQVRFSHEPYKWMPESMSVRQAGDFLDQKMGGASVVEVVIDTGKENGLYEPRIIQGLETLKQELEKIKEGPISIGKTLSVVDIIKETNRALNENQQAFYRIPNNRDLIAQELLLFENSGSDDLEDFVDSQFSKARFTLKMPWTDSIYLEILSEDLEKRFQQQLGDDVTITVTGMNALLGRTMAATIFSMTESYIIAAIVITLMMILLLGSVRIGLISMIPNLTPIILTVGIMGWLDLPMDLFTILIGSIAIGLAVDDTIHFMHNFRRYHLETGDVADSVRRTLLTSGRAMLVTSVVLCIGFFIYMFSILTNLFNFGLLTGFAIAMALLADFFLAPALMMYFYQQNTTAVEE